MSASATVAAAIGVSKSFGGQLALDHVSLEVTAGEAVGLLGPNGAGKTTLISLLTGLRRADAGRVTLLGGMPTDPVSRLGLGVTPQATAVPASLRVREIVALVSAHFPDARPCPGLLEEFGLTEVADRQSGGLSGGQQRRLLVALALVGRPRIVLLDEPTTGLDVEARETLWAALHRFRAGGGTMVITSHYLAEIEALASRVVVMDRGRIIADGTVAQIRRHVELRHISLVTSATVAVLSTLPGVVSVEAPVTQSSADGVTRIATRDADAAVRALIRADIPFANLEVHGATLEEAFLALTAAAPRPGERP